MRRPDRNRASPAPPPRLCPRPARATSRPRPCCAAPDRPASRLRPTPRAPPAHLDSPDPALCPAPRAASQSSFSPSCPRLSRGRMFHVKHSSSSGPRLRCPSQPTPARRVIPLAPPPSPVVSPVPDPVFAMRVLAPVPDPSHLLLSNPSAHAPPLSPPPPPPRGPPPPRPRGARAGGGGGARPAGGVLARRASIGGRGFAIVAKTRVGRRRPPASCAWAAPPACAPPRPRPRRAAFPRRCHGFPERRLQRGL